MNNIRWETHDTPNSLFGYVPHMKRNKYYVGPYNDVDIVADVRINGTKTWADLNVPFASIDEARQWCEVIEATGAYL